MSKKSKKIIISVLLFILLMFCFSQIIFAEWSPNFDKLTNGEVKKSGNRIIDIMGSIINITQVIGMGLGILIAVFIGIKYFAATPAGKAEVKNSAINYILGAVLMFSAAAILQIVKMFIESNVTYD